MKRWHGEAVFAGEAQGDILRLEEPLSFWGGFDPHTGIILDVHHPQQGAAVGGRILLLRETRGSGGTPAAVAEAIRCGVAPAAFILPKADTNLTAGVQVAAKLYGIRCPVVVIDRLDYQEIGETRRIKITTAGRIIQLA